MHLTVQHTRLFRAIYRSPQQRYIKYAYIVKIMLLALLIFLLSLHQSIFAMNNRKEYLQQYHLKNYVSTGNPIGRPSDLPQYDFSGIYQLRCTVNDKIYIGQAQNILNRFNEHRRNRNGHLIYRDCILYRAIKKYGWGKFEISVLEKVDDISLLNQREIFWIDKLNPEYNTKDGGNCARGWNHTKEAKRKMSETKSKMYIGVNNPFYGKTHSEETKQKIREAKLGKKISDTSKMKEAYNPERFYKKVVNTNTLEVFNSVSDASKSIGVNQSSLSNCLRGKTKTCGGFKWKYYES